MATQRPYHHGDLSAALVTAAYELARTGGADAIGVREVTRAVGVTPNAAYRHFADRSALVLAAADRAQEDVATAMRARLQRAGRSHDPHRRAIARLRAVGLGYVDFARSEPGLFQLAFRSHEQFVDTRDAPPAPFQLLMAALDELVAVGALTPARRTNAEWSCWSAVHGVADLATRGPLRAVPDATVDKLVARVVDTVITGVIG